MMPKKNSKLKGSTLVEVMIALAISSFCAALAVVIYLNIQKSSLPFFKLKASEMAAFYMQETLIKKTFFEETYKAEEFTIKKFISRNELFADCITIRMAVFDGAKKKLMELETTVNENSVEQE